MARGADPVVVRLRHEGDGAAALVRDLLEPGLVDDVVVGGAQRVAEAEVDLVLAGPRLALRGLDDHPGRLHRRPHRAEERLVEARREDVVVEDVRHRGREVVVVLRVRLEVGLAEEEELELRAEHRLEAELARLLDLRLQHLARRRARPASRRATRRRTAPSPWPRATGSGAAWRGRAAARSRRSRAPSSRSRSREPDPSPSRARAGSCSPRRGDRPRSRRGRTRRRAASPSGGPACR